MLSLLPRLQIAADGAHRHRNNNSTGRDVIVSTERETPNEHGRTAIPFDMVTLARSHSTAAPLAPIYAYARDKGTCLMHVPEEEWDARLREGGDSASQALLENFFSNSGVRFPVSAQSAEGIEMTLLCIRLQSQGVFVTHLAHDPDCANISIVRICFRVAGRFSTSRMRTLVFFIVF